MAEIQTPAEDDPRMDIDVVPDPVARMASTAAAWVFVAAFAGLTLA